MNNTDTAILLSTILGVSAHYANKEIVYYESITREFTKLFPITAIEESSGNKTSCDIEYFNTLVRKNEKKKRKCLRCGIAFYSTNYGNRCCGSCIRQNQKMSYNASYILK